MAKKAVKYSSAIAKKICSRLKKGESLRNICKDAGMPSTNAVYNWLLDHREENKVEMDDFRKMYEDAREIGAEIEFEELGEYALKAQEDIVGNDKSDNARVQAIKLYIDTKKWILSKKFPKKYGDKVDVTSGGKEIKEARPVTINYFAPTTAT